MYPIYPQKPIAATFGVTCGSTIIALPDLPSAAEIAWIQIEEKAVRARFDATSTVTSGTGGGLGMPINDINTPWYEFRGWDVLNRMRLVGDGGDAVINVVYLGQVQP